MRDGNKIPILTPKLSPNKHPSSNLPPAMTTMESTHTHHRLFDFAKTALFKIFLFPYATVCELFCGQVTDVDKFDDALIGHYIGIDVEGMSHVRGAWESPRKPYTSQFIELDPCTENMEPHLLDKCGTVDIVCCMQHLQICFESEERARVLLRNVSSLLKPGGYFFGITPDSSMIWAKYQKMVEAYHNRSGGMKPNVVPNCIRSESYMITFDVEEEKFPLFGKKYQLKFASDATAETHCLVHFPSFIRLAREAGLEYVEIQNLTEFYDDNRAQFGSLILKFGPNLVDSRGRLVPRSYDVLGLYTTFIFKKPDPDMAPPITTPMLPHGSHIYGERDLQGANWRDDALNGSSEPPPGLGKIADQKGILGVGPAELRLPLPEA